MNLLLDTHALIWWLEDDERLSDSADNAISDPENSVFVSAASAWEIANKVRIGKLPSVAAIAARLDLEIGREGFRPLAVSFEHGLKAGFLLRSHRDPFDRMLMAQALVEGLTLVSNEAIFDSFGVSRVW